MGRKKAEATEPTLDLGALGSPPPATGGEEKKISKMDAVREALAEGLEKAAEGVEWIKAKHGVELTPATWNVYKSKVKGGGADGQTTAPSPRVSHKTATLREPTLADLLKVDKLVEESKYELDEYISLIENLAGIVESVGGMNQLLKILEAIKQFKGK